MPLGVRDGDAVREGVKDSVGVTDGVGEGEAMKQASCEVAPLFDHVPGGHAAHDDDP